MSLILKGASLLGKGALIGAGSTAGSGLLSKLGTFLTSPTGTALTGLLGVGVGAAAAPGPLLGGGIARALPVRRDGAGLLGLPRRRRRGRGISALELRGFRKVANLLHRYYAAAPAGVKRGAVKKGGRR